MRYVIALAMVSALAMGAAMKDASASTPDEASIVNSGSTNTAGYRIDVRSDGSAHLTLQSRPGPGAPNEPKTFSIAASLTARFFADLKAVRAGNVTGEPCMKSASFGTSTHVSWQDWKSPDLDCPSKNTLLGALIRDVNAIRQASGVGTFPGIHRTPGSGGPLRVEPSPSSKPH